MGKHFAAGGETNAVNGPVGAGVSGWRAAPGFWAQLGPSLDGRDVSRHHCPAAAIFCGEAVVFRKRLACR